MLKLTSLDDVVLVTHMGCLDGSGCTILFLAAGGKMENVRFVAAGMVERFVKSDPAIQSDKVLLFTDVGVNGPKYADILEKRGNVILLDHHVTSSHMKDRPWCLIDSDENGDCSKCASVMFLEYLRSCGMLLDTREYDWLVRVIDDLDRWQKKEKMSELLGTMMVFLGQRDFIDRFKNVSERYSRMESNSIGFFEESSEFFNIDERMVMSILIKRRDQSIASAIKKAIVRDVSYETSDGTQMEVKVAYVVSSEPNVSLLLDELKIEKSKEANVFALVNFDKRVVSLRSNVIDVSEMAKYFSGGGHKNAAGHPIPQSLINSIIEEIHA